ncbi:MAG: hypothetical protein V4489_07720 [Chlamydiota bacterium]
MSFPIEKNTHTHTNTCEHAPNKPTPPTNLNFCQPASGGFKMPTVTSMKLSGDDKTNQAMLKMLGSNNATFKSFKK